MFDVFMKLKPNEIKNSKINYYTMVIYSEIKNMLPQNTMKYNDFQSSCCNNSANSGESAGIIIESRLCCSCQSSINILFKPGAPDSKRLAQILEENLKNVFKNSCRKINTIPGGNENISGIPTVTIRFNFSCGKNSLSWLLKNIENIPAVVTMSLTEFFGIPFAAYRNKKIGSSKTDAAVFKRPNNNSEIIQTVEPGEKIEIISQWEDWYIIKKNNSSGYIHSRFINT
ncbi:MAG: SH3 domain-containing protein [Clostridia bacterium]|nr:SH3 domain-containing protein [Clostridia bacterium]